MNYNLITGISFLISAASVPLLIFFSQNKKVFDFPEGDELKIHKKPVSILGGFSLFLAAMTAFLFLNYQNYNYRYIFFILGCLIIFLLGLWDDLKWKHISARKPYFKFFLLTVCSLAAAFVLYFSGYKSYLLIFSAFIYIFILINAINYQDGMDGQAGILVFISLIGFSVLSYISGDKFSLEISLAFLGAVLGFLIYNFPPAKIFMGDSGAYLLGFVLATLVLNFSNNILSALFIIGLPLFDGVYTNLRRLLKGKSIFLGDREHFYDKMIKKGFSVKKTLFISAVVQTLFVISGVLVAI